MKRFVSLAAPLAALVFAAAVVGFGAMFPGFSHAGHPVGLLGASAVPRATAFNAMAFLVPGLLAAIAALGVRAKLGAAGWAARIGSQALLLSALAFAAQGLLPLDSSDLDAAGSRLHAGAWTAWWLAFVVAAVLLRIGQSARPAGIAANAVAACAAATLAFALLAPAVLPPGLCQRLAFAFWFLGLWLAARCQP